MNSDVFYWLFDIPKESGTIIIIIKKDQNDLDQFNQICYDLCKKYIT